MHVHLYDSCALREELVGRSVGAILIEQIGFFLSYDRYKLGLSNSVNQYFIGIQILCVEYINLNTHGDKNWSNSW